MGRNVGKKEESQKIKCYDGAFLEKVDDRYVYRDLENKVEIKIHRTGFKFIEGSAKFEFSSPGKGALKKSYEKLKIMLMDSKKEKKFSSQGKIECEYPEYYYPIKLIKEEVYRRLKSFRISSPRGKMYDHLDWKYGKFTSSQIRRAIELDQYCEKHPNPGECDENLIEIVFESDFPLEDLFAIADKYGSLDLAYDIMDWLNDNGIDYQNLTEEEVRDLEDRFSYYYDQMSADYFGLDNDPRDLSKAGYYDYQ